MQLKRLTLTQMRSYERAEFNFKPGMNLIVGINGAGKSTVLDALRIMLSQVLPRLTVSKSKPIYFSTDDQTGDISNGQGSLTVELQFEALGTPFTYFVHESREEFGESTVSEDIEQQFSHHVSREQRVQLRRKPQEGHRIEDVRKLTRDDGAMLKQLRAGLEQPIGVFYSTRRSLFNMTQGSKTRSAGGQVAAFADALASHELSVREFAEWWLTREALAEETTGTTLLRFLEVLRSVAERFLDNFSHLRAVREPTTTLLLDKSDTTLDVRQLSDGERGILALVLDLARRLAQANPKLEDPLRDGKAVVLIDELDLHLHPSWQRTVVQKLTETFPNCQFIATTHSPFVVQSLKSGQLINLGVLDDEDTLPEVVNKEEYVDKSVEDITETVMGVEMPQKSERYLEMMKAAEEYFRLLRTAPAKSEDQEALKRKLDELSEPYSDDPAYMALLKVERETHLRKD